jgi:hypothetical protein
VGFAFARFEGIVARNYVGRYNQFGDRGLRFPVSRLLGLLAAGETKETILKAYPYLEPEDIDEALRYAAALAEDEIVEFAT